MAGIRGVVVLAFTVCASQKVFPQAAWGSPNRYGLLRQVGHRVVVTKMVRCVRHSAYVTGRCQCCLMLPTYSRAPANSDTSSSAELRSVIEFGSGYCRSDHTCRVSDTNRREFYGHFRASKATLLSLFDERSANSLTLSEVSHNSSSLARPSLFRNGIENDKRDAVNSIAIHPSYESQVHVERHDSGQSNCSPRDPVYSGKFSSCSAMSGWLLLPEVSSGARSGVCPDASAVAIPGSW